VDAGADGIFVPGVSDAEVIRELAANIARPLNVLAIPGATQAAVAVRDGQAVPPSVRYADLQASMVSYARN
jgi:2-methylisocitrate lyase-like PEP mutase family enzyme